MYRFTQVSSALQVVSGKDQGSRQEKQLLKLVTNGNPSLKHLEDCIKSKMLFCIERFKESHAFEQT